MAAVVDLVFTLLGLCGVEKWIREIFGSIKLQRVWYTSKA
jgi:hypothetical protein